MQLPSSWLHTILVLTSLSRSGTPCSHTVRPLSIIGPRISVRGYPFRGRSRLNLSYCLVRPHRSATAGLSTPIDCTDANPAALIMLMSCMPLGPPGPRAQAQACDVIIMLHGAGGGFPSDAAISNSFQAKSQATPLFSIEYTE